MVTRSGPSASERADDVALTIAEAGLDLFLRDGFARVSIDMIADRAGVSRRTVFRHFRSKQDVPFPDHGPRLRLQRRILDSADERGDAIDVVIGCGLAMMADHISYRDVVQKRFQLGQDELLIREREYVENAHYAAATRGFLESRFRGADARTRAEVFAAAFDAVYRSVLRSWAASGGAVDAVGELRTRVGAAMRLFTPQARGATDTTSIADSVVVAVLPATTENLRRIETLVTDAR